MIELTVGVNMICKYCGINQPIELFQKCKEVNGIIYYRKKCTPCKVKTQRKRTQKNQAEIKQLKQLAQCAHCGISDYRVLEFHHLDPKLKEREVSLMYNFSLENIKKEIAKCIVLCANCHRILHTK